MSWGTKSGNSQALQRDSHEAKAERSLAKAESAMAAVERLKLEAMHRRDMLRRARKAAALGLPVPPSVARELGLLPQDAASAGAAAAPDHDQARSLKSPPAQAPGDALPLLPSTTATVGRRGVGSDRLNVGSPQPTDSTAIATQAAMPPTASSRRYSSSRGGAEGFNGSPLGAAAAVGITTLSHALRNEGASVALSGPVAVTVAADLDAAASSMLSHRDAAKSSGGSLADLRPSAGAGSVAASGSGFGGIMMSPQAQALTALPPTATAGVNIGAASGAGVVPQEVLAPVGGANAMKLVDEDADVEGFIDLSGWQRDIHLSMPFAQAALVHQSMAAMQSETRNSIRRARRAAKLHAENAAREKRLADELALNKAALQVEFNL